jgi:DNA-cytosine methyltransferase
MVKLQLLDLFSGIGGFSLGLESTGFFKTIAFVEKDKFCRQVLQKNFNNIPIEEDIRNVRGERYKADIITGGFPCQPFSVAGKRKGTDDDRYLWDETIRVVAECKPRWFIGENVEGIININNGMVLRQVQTDLEEQGFQVQCLVIPASGIGAWHQRKRIWIIAYSHNNGSYRSQRMRPSRAATNRKTGYLSEMIKSTQHQHRIQHLERTKKYKQGGTPLPMAVKMFPTPTPTCENGGEQSSRVEMTENGGFVLRKKNKPDMTFGAKLSDAMIYLEKKKEQPGGKLNPNFVEFLMGYPMNWTKIDQAE